MVIIDGYRLILPVFQTNRTHVRLIAFQTQFAHLLPGLFKSYLVIRFNCIVATAVKNTKDSVIRLALRRSLWLILLFAIFEAILSSHHRFLLFVNHLRFCQSILSVVKLVFILIQRLFLLHFYE